MKAILTFHSIDDSGSVLSYPPGQFAYLLETLRRKKIPIVDLTTIMDPATEHGVALTFDDGMYSLFSDAMPVLKDFEAPAHVFITTNAINSDQKWPRQPSDVPGFKMLGWPEIESLHANNVFIDAHTGSHPDMRNLSASQLVDECEMADSEIERRIGRRPEFFAYPFGYHNKRARDYCRTRYRASVTTELRSLSAGDDVAALPRLDTYYLRTTQFIDKLDSLPVGAYLRFRWLLRTLRGSHCTASHNSGSS
jgi:peptidoglycan/xylan/chitin deacetylase (PgdA/CDA1 family)